MSESALIIIPLVRPNVTVSLGNPGSDHWILLLTSRNLLVRCGKFKYLINRKYIPRGVYIFLLFHRTFISIGSAGIFERHDVFVYFICLLLLIHAVAEVLDTSNSIFNIDTENVEGPYFATILDSQSLAEPQIADASIFDNTSFESSTSDTGENLFSVSPGSDDSTDLAFIHGTSALNYIPADSDVLYSTQDTDSKVLLS